MPLDQYRIELPSFAKLHEAFLANVREQRRFLITFKTGQHLVGVPTGSTTETPVGEHSEFVLLTRSCTYKLPYDEVAFAEALADTPGLRPSDGAEAPPEPCAAPILRVKSEKFQILDARSQLEADLGASLGVFGCALLYMDIDHFGELNREHLETEVDRTVLPSFQRLVDDTAKGHGFAYAEGGDEVIVLLTNADGRMACAFAESLREIVAAQAFHVGGKRCGITVSIGVACAREAAELVSIQQRANEAKRLAKEEGRDRVVLDRASG